MTATNSVVNNISEKNTKKVALHHLLTGFCGILGLILLQRRHALGANRHGREVMQQGRGRGGKCPKETCGQERRVESDDKAVIRLDAFHELRTQCAEFGEVAQVFDAEGHIGGFAGNVAGIAHGNRHVRGSQCGRIVDSFAHHNHAAAFGLHFFHIAVLVFGQHLRKECVDAQKLRRAFSGFLAIAGNHRHMPDSAFAQHADGFGGFVTRRVANAKHSREVPANGKVNHGCGSGEFVNLFL